MFRQCAGVYWRDRERRVVVVTCLYSVETLQQLSRSLLSSRYSQPVSNFLLPALARHAQFPFVRLLHSLLPPQLAASVSSMADTDGDWCLAVEPTIWLLHSTITLAAPHLGQLAHGCYSVNTHTHTHPHTHTLAQLLSCRLTLPHACC